MRLLSWVAAVDAPDLVLKDGLGAYRRREIRAPFDLLAQHTESLRQTDLLLIWADVPGETDWLALEAAQPLLPAAGCVLLCRPLSASQLRRAMRAGVRLVLERPLEAPVLHGELARIAGQLLHDGRQSARMMTFCSASGGAGVSLLAANFAAVRAAQQHERVLLIDLCQSFAASHLYLSERTPTRTFLDLCGPAQRPDAALLAAAVLNVGSDFDLLAGPADPISAGDADAAQIDAVLALAGQMYDLIVVDIGQRFSPQSIVVLDRSDLVSVVMQATLPHLSATHRLSELLGALDVGHDRTALWLNRYEPRRAELKAALIGERLGYPSLTVLPEDPAAVALSVLQGRQLAGVAGRSELSRALCAAAARFWPPSPTAAPPKRGFRLPFFGRLGG